MAAVTPMMAQYLETKKEYNDCILFYRLGDFYEMFFDDALTCSKELELTLTGKSCGLEERAPMCGVPYHAVEGYLDKLVKKGYKVAICEQVEDPKLAKGIVKREVIRIVTPGTNMSRQSLDDGKNNYLMGIVYVTASFGISVVDVTTGDYFVTEVNSLSKVLDEISKYNPAEIICNESFLMSGADINELTDRLGISLSAVANWYFDDEKCKKCLMDHFGVASLQGLGLDSYVVGTSAAGAVLQYLYETQKTSLAHINKIRTYVTSDFMFIDRATCRNLELTETMREKNKKGSLLWVLDKTKTAMGARALRGLVSKPLVNKDQIVLRLDAVEELKNEMILREELREYLAPIYDLERLITKISYKSANPRDLIALKTSLAMLPDIKTTLEPLKSKQLSDYYNDFDTLKDLYELIDASIDEEPPLTIREGGIIKEGYNEDVDLLRKSKLEGKTWLASLEEEERENTGIKNLKIKYNKVFGYYFDVTNSYKDLVPADWVRKQTLTGSERYTTDRLKKLEDTILGAEDKLYALEYDLFVNIRDTIFEHMERVQNTAKIIAGIDMLASLAYVAETNNYVRPSINTKGKIDIKDGRHPVIEKMLSNCMFIENDTYLDNRKNRLSIITGPNMAGKSTYMRQTALIVLMAQIGSFVPAKEADICVCDRIFTRVGASDDLASGQSTFMVEMTEVANILRNATKDSLIILDEIGRGTSTFDGLAIAWAVVEYICNNNSIGAKTLFATHYHELTELEGKIPGVNNYCIAVKEQGEDIVFLRKIVKGGADKSYGIQVARLAGVPEPVLNRAKEIVEGLTANDINKKARSLLEHNQTRFHKKEEQMSGSMSQISIFDIMNKTEGFDDIILEIHDMDLNNVTPMEALNILCKYQKRMKEKF
ncbi:MAG: DNA mismatch repair protein MutS [Lachnospiraceae bacterium]|nr:DNA mismatch repair protein MutS [Lachnoclostridium sp.]MDY2600039.1 DNA mismatch repair protein MutS [Lachnospiraceae bacterium]